MNMEIHCRSETLYEGNGTALTITLRTEFTRAADQQKSHRNTNSRHRAREAQPLHTFP
jgi:hypothetical protein